MDFTAECRANLLLLYQQETIINGKYILFQGGVNVFSLPLPHPRQNEKKYLFQDRVPDYTRAMREIAPKPMSSSFSFLPFFSSRMKWAETFAPRLIRARFL